MEVYGQVVRIPYLRTASTPSDYAGLSEMLKHGSECN